VLRLSIQEGVKTESHHANLKVAGQDGSVAQFKIQRHNPLSRLMKAYCERQVGPALPGPARRLSPFIFLKNEIISVLPPQLEMEDEDTMDVFQQQAGGEC
ncbi:SMO3L protein, partial [Calyptomena viridis]|nr:SMO3L protein [Calyptomena viridis]